MFFTLLKIWSQDFAAPQDVAFREPGMFISGAHHPGPSVIIAPFYFEEISEDTPVDGAGPLHDSGFPNHFSFYAASTLPPGSQDARGSCSPHPLFLRYCDLRL
ncbi:MAG: hypothetical protein EAZ89_00480 [Bacteroidetes bacterium]|nr:MAG: hypothetical protein EAZ89_00480 [Bacteroidota bacterium]